MAQERKQPDAQRPTQTKSDRPPATAPAGGPEAYPPVRPDDAIEIPRDTLGEHD